MEGEEEEEKEQKERKEKKRLKVVLYAVLRRANTPGWSFRFSWFNK